MGVDIIIPVYNAYGDLQICLQSIYQHTEFVENRLILINDKSSDERILTYLDAQKRDNVIVIHNERNRGFSYNINIGMAQSQDRDVILLNSDTIVTKGWVEKMVNCAYSDSFIGTVTPLSNNATLCSVPNFCEENELPEGFSVDRMAAIVEGCSLKRYPRITVANGFCMFIKREVIQLIGNFDEVTFGYGYGEENDFCNRAEQMGYIHVMCDDTYIYHSGTKSFASKEKEAYIKEHDRILNDRYPQQMHNNAVYCRDNPNGWVGKNIAFYLNIWDGKKNILYLLHSDFREGSSDNIGGTQLHVKHLVQGLRGDMNLFVVARNREYLQVTTYTDDNEYVFKFYIGKEETFQLLRNRKLAEIFGTILAGFKINLVHVHHTRTASLDIFYEADRLGIPIIFTVHDFYFVCPNEKLLNEQGEVCVGNASGCKSCLKQTKGICEKNDYLDMWRRQHRAALGMCKYIITPSESAKEILGNVYPQYKDKICVIGHGVDAPEILDICERQIVKTNEVDYRIESVNEGRQGPVITGTAQFTNAPGIQHKTILRVEDEAGKVVMVPTNFRRDLAELCRFYAYLPACLFKVGKLTITPILLKDGRYYQKNDSGYTVPEMPYTDKNHFKVAFIGGINEEKGGKVISHIIKHDLDGVQWFVIGMIGEKGLASLNKKNLIKMGGYYPEDIATFLKYHRIDAVCILSKWPETFSYTLSEAVINGIPVIAAGIGALEKRVGKNGFGRIVPYQEPEVVRQTLQVIEEWKCRDGEYREVKKCAEKYMHDTLEQMIGKYREIYKSIWTETTVLCDKECTDIQKKIYHAYAESTGKTGSELELLEKISMLEEQVNAINNSTAVRLALRLTQVKFPFKKEIKFFLRRYIK